MIPDFRQPLPPSRIVQLTALRAAFPGYTFNVIVTGDKPRIEAVAKDLTSPVYCLISADAREIWRELAVTVKVAYGVSVRPQPC
jgi:hypothetical protein